MPFHTWMRYWRHSTQTAWNHLKVNYIVLKFCSRNNLELESLEEVHLITSLLCLVAAHDFRAAIDETGDEQLSRNYRHLGENNHF